MALSRQEIKNRIRSVDSTKKITKVMQLIASTELTKQRKAMEQNHEYALGLEKALHFALNSVNDSYATKENEGKPALVFVIASDMGLCGSYNANVLRFMQNAINEEDKIIMIGARGETWAQAHHVDLESNIEDLNLDTAYSRLSKEMDMALDLFKRKEISRIQILYTHYKNTLTYLPRLETVLPVQPKEDLESVNALTEFEPKESAMLDTIIPLVVRSMLYARYLESKTSEQASRRMAMEAATDNANELHDELMLAYNQARQSAITNEIIDIVGGANALK